MFAIFEEDNFIRYVEKLSQFRGYLVVVCVKDTIGFCVERDGYRALRRMGLKKLGDGSKYDQNHWRGYVAMIVNGKVVYEKLAPYNQSVLAKKKIHGIRVEAFSSPYEASDEASIKIDGQEYCVNERGLNFVVVDLVNRVLVDSIAFDTHAPDHKALCRRREAKVLTSDNLHTEIELLRNALETREMKNELLLWQLFRKEDESVEAAKKRFFTLLPDGDKEVRMMQLVGVLLLKRFDRFCREHNLTYWLSFGGLLGAVRQGKCIPWDDDIDVCMMRDELKQFLSIVTEDMPDDFCVDNRIVISDFDLCHDYQIYFPELPTLYLDIFIYDYVKEVTEDGIDRMVEYNRKVAEEGWALYRETSGEDQSRAVDVEKVDARYLAIFEKYQKKAIADVGITDRENAGGMVWALDNCRQNVRGDNVSLDVVFPTSEIMLEGQMFLAPRDPEGYCNRLFGDYFSLPNDMLTHRHFQLSEEERTKLESFLCKHLPEIGMDTEWI